MENQLKFNRFGIMLDCSRNAVPNLEFLKSFIDDIADMGYNCLQLYTEETYEMDGEPFWGYLRGRFTKDELKEINAYGKEKGVELIPCIQTLAHVNQAVRWSPYYDFCDCNDILLIGDERTYALIDKMFATMRECFDTEYINIGMDEAHFVGLGKYLDKNGYRNRFDIILEHLTKVVEIAKKYNFKPAMWSDMFFRLANNGTYTCKNPKPIPPEVQEKVPNEVSLIYWDYYSKDKETFDNMVKGHLGFKNEIWFAGGVWSWGGFTPSNFTSLEAHDIAINSCIEFGIKNVLVTLWGDNGHETSKLATHAGLFYTACLAKGITDVDVIDKLFAEKYGVTMRDFLKIDYANMIQEKPTLENHIGSKANNPSKYMFYNDLLLGFCDKTVKDGVEDLYKQYAEELKPLTKHPKFGYVFDVQQKLCEVLAIKYALGVKLRTAYKAGDKKALKKHVSLIKPLIKKVELFYNALEKQWFTENKPHGFEVQDARIGGVIKRLEHSYERLNAYLKGAIKNLPELEEEILPPYNNPEKAGFTEYKNLYHINVTTSVL